MCVYTASVWYVCLNEYACVFDCVHNCKICDKKEVGTVIQHAI
uniref:Uncharacterized protein n=1 Tax=Anguilla anguilla TaxID=7936 RepID=A0A0E9XPG1_ANGAN